MNGKRRRAWRWVLALGVIVQLTTCQLTHAPDSAAISEQVQAFLADFFRAALAAYVL